MLEDNGAAIDRDRKNITFPRDMIIEQVAKAPEKVVLCGQDPKNDLHLTQNRVHLGTGGAAIKILDLETGDIRPTTLKDLYEVSRLVDQLDNIHFLVRPCIATDIDEADYDINMFYACLAASSKHVMAGTLAQLHAEQLAGITICQLTKAGAPLLCSPLPMSSLSLMMKLLETAARFSKALTAMQSTLPWK